MSDFSLGEFLGQVQRSMGGPGTGPLSGYVFGPDFFRKQTYLQVSDTFTATYGRKVFDALNNRSVFYNAIKKVDWGPTTGWRIRSDRGTGNSRPVTETGALPTIDVSAYQGITSNPRIVGSTFGVSMIGQAVSPLEGGIGNQYAVEQEAKSRDHIKEINQELLLSSSTIATGAATCAQGEMFRVGDTIANSTSDTAETITAISGDTITGQTSADGEIVYVKSRAGLTSLDDIVEEDGRTIAGVSVTNGADVYNVTTRTAAAYAAAAAVLDNNGTERDLTLDLLDNAIRSSRARGGEPKLIVLDYTQWDKLNALLLANQRYVDYQDYTVGVGDETTYPGTQAGFQLVTYKGIPVLPDADVRAGVNADDTDQGGRVYVLDTDFLEIAIMYPTQYLENRDYFAANAMVIRGLFFTMAEMRALRFDVHSKIADLTT